MALDTAMLAAGLILILAIFGVVLFFVILGALMGVAWVADCLRRCPRCRRMGGMSLQGAYLWDGTHGGGLVSFFECQHCSARLAREDGGAYRDADEEEWRQHTQPVDDEKVKAELRSFFDDDPSAMPKWLPKK